jgi:hypothetical protein
MSDEIRRRFSMADAMVLGVVLLLLAALLLPLVVAKRVPARITQCKNNIRQITLAHLANASRGANDAFGGYLETLPLAGAPATPGSTESLRDRREIIVAWPTKLLPALDEMTVYEQLLRNDDYRELTFDSPPVLEIFLCPSDPQIDPTAGGLSYVVNSGMPDLVEASEDQPSDLRANGVFHDQRPGRFGPKVRMTDVKDGQSYTILLSENVHRDPAGSASQPGNTWLRPATGATNLEQWYGMVWVVDPRNPRSPQPSLMDRFNGDTRPENQRDQLYAASGTRFARPASEHPEVFNVAFCGGSVNEIHEDIDYAVYQQLMTPDGAKAAPADAPNQRFEKTLPDDLRFMNPPITDADY